LGLVPLYLSMCQRSATSLLVEERHHEGTSWIAALVVPSLTHAEKKNDRKSCLGTPTNSEWAETHNEDSTINSGGKVFDSTTGDSLGELYEYLCMCRSDFDEVCKMAPPAPGGAIYINYFRGGANISRDKCFWSHGFSLSN